MGADLKSEDICKCNPTIYGSFRCHLHTYLFESPKTVSSMWGTIGVCGYYGNEYPIYLYFLIDGEWVLERTWTMIGDGWNSYIPHPNPFNIAFEPTTIEGFEFRGGVWEPPDSPYGPFILDSYGVILATEPSSPEFPYWILGLLGLLGIAGLYIKKRKK